MSDADGPAAPSGPDRSRRLPPHTPKRRRRAAGLAIALLATAVVLVLTLQPMPAEGRRVQLTPVWCLVCGDVGMQDVLQNVLMLLPLGFGLALAGWRWGRAAATGLALAVAVEVLQYAVVPGRDASLSDVVTNTIGTALGALVGEHVDGLLRPSPRAAARLALGTLAAWGVLWTGAGWLLGASAGPAPWHAELQPQLIDAPAFAGRMTAAELSGTPLAPGRQPVPPAVLAAYARDSVAFRAEAVMPPPSPVRTGLLEVRDGDSTVQLTVAEQRGAIRFAMRTRSSLLRLRPIAFRVSDPPVPAGTPVTLGIRRDAAVIVVPARLAGEADRVAPIGPHWLATLLLPVDARPGPGWEAFAYLWVVALLLPAGWWVTHAPGASRLTLAFTAFAVVIGGLRTVPPAFRLSHTSALGWAMACGALALGLLLGRGLATRADA